MYSLQLTHPFGLLISGGTKTGKITFVKKLLGNVQVMIDLPPENIKYFYSEYQDTFAEIKSLVPGIEFIEGVPDTIFNSINPKIRNLYIFDDMMGERNAVIAKLFTKKLIMVIFVWLTFYRTYFIKAKITASSFINSVSESRTDSKT